VTPHRRIVFPPRPRRRDVESVFPTQLARPLGPRQRLLHHALCDVETEPLCAPAVLLLFLALGDHAGVRISEGQVIEGIPLPADPWPPDQAGMGRVLFAS